MLSMLITSCNDVSPNLDTHIENSLLRHLIQTEMNENGKKKVQHFLKIKIHKIKR